MGRRRCHGPGKNSRDACASVLHHEAQCVTLLLSKTMYEDLISGGLHDFNATRGTIDRRKKAAQEQCLGYK